MSYARKSAAVIGTALLVGVLTLISEPAFAATVDVCPGLPGTSVSGGLPRSRVRLAAGQKLRVLAIGSSTTAGVGAGGAESFPTAAAASLRRLLPRRNIELITAGSSGERAPSAASRIEQHVSGREVDLVIWQVGTNDARSGSIDGMRAALDRGIRAARQAGADVMLVDPQHYPGADPGDYERFVAAISDAGRRHGIPVVSRYQWMKQVSRQTGAPSLLAFDRFHNNALGHQCLGRGVAQAIAVRAN